MKDDKQVLREEHLMCKKHLIVAVENIGIGRDNSRNYDSERRSKIQNAFITSIRAVSRAQIKEKQLMAQKWCVQHNDTIGRKLIYETNMYF